MSGVSEGGIILPRGGGIPVDPSDPTKGTIEPVLDNRTLTGAILELQQVVGQIGTVQQITGGAMYQAIGELGNLVECLAYLVIPAEERDALNTDDDEQSINVMTAQDSLVEFLRQRNEARKEAVAEQPVDPALAGPEATPPVPPPVNPEDDGDGS